MENLNLAEILNNAPAGTKLYSLVFGECELLGVVEGMISVQSCCGNAFFFANGTYYDDCGECLLFPSKDNRDWKNFKVKKYKVGDHLFRVETKDVYFLTRESKSRDGFWAKIINCDTDDCEAFISDKDLDDYVGIIKFNPNWLKPFDRVIVYDDMNGTWFATLFSHYNKDSCNPYTTSDGCYYKRCVPFNGETKHLIGTTVDEPAFYKLTKDEKDNV